MNNEYYDNNNVNITNKQSNSQKIVFIFLILYFGFQIFARYDFDPILTKNILKIFSPSLLIFVCKRI